MAGYVCIENNNVTALLDYEPNAPTTVRVVTITDAQYDQLRAGTHVFNTSNDSITPVSAEAQAEEAQAEANGLEREFLNNTDWKVLRHIREQHLGLTTTLTAEEYTALEQQRQDASDRIIE